MKRFVSIVAIALIFGTSSLTAVAGKAKTGNGGPSGKHYNVNLIGTTKGALPEGGASSGGAALFIPLRTATGPSEAICTDESGNQTWFIDDEDATWTDVEPSGGARIYFTPTTTGGFEIIDRDATDGRAEIQVPVSDDGDRYILLDLYVRVLGKPGGCAEITGYAFDGAQNLWFWSGTIALDRKTGKSSFVKTTDIFDVHYCTVVEGACEAGTEVELSVFNDIFDEYFWQIYNDGTRLIQMRFYPRD